MKSPSMAVVPGGTDGRMQFLTICAGALIEVAGEAQPSGLIDVICDGRVVTMFQRDIEDRGEPILARAV